VLITLYESAPELPTKFAETMSVILPAGPRLAAFDRGASPPAHVQSPSRLLGTIIGGPGNSATS